MKKNIWLDGMMGLVVGDALGNPVQFMTRDQIKNRGPVTGMEAGGVYNTPIGTWTDDSSMALATLSSIREKGGIDLNGIMTNFVRWNSDDEFTPNCEAFDQGNTCRVAIMNYERTHDVKTCGRTGEFANGNGSLMRILPACLYLAQRCANVCTSDDQAIETIHQVTAITHNHLRAQMANGIYYFLVKELIYNKENTSLSMLIQSGLDNAFRYYGHDLRNLTEISYFGRLFSMEEFAKAEEVDIQSSGYVIDTLEAAIWSLITTDSYSECLLKAVNLGDDADTVGAVAGGLAGLYYGYEGIPQEWKDVIIRKEWIEELCS